ncbi:MOSC domain-containing protein [Colwellia ponticola]|uniref:MOSC domain-containing protein n=1 Tax=Colwellia ponticola TaxID=2304625 RepID=A0A8H2JNB3_9GAMM|nr:MOSC domain-containing protein [Colwellia ponticola]TMM45396.1 MOSC domain-containing protein [Colwellia ponticola]
MQKNYVLDNIYCSKVTERYGMATAIDKHCISTRLYLSDEGLAGDECADKYHHGGLDRALHQYPKEHYTYWQEKYANTVAQWQAPGMGENLSSVGMTEQNIFLGDCYQWGEAIIEVSQPRSPCYKLNKRWGIEAFSVVMQNMSRCGWLYRVIKPGMVSVNEPLVLLSRVDNAMSISAVCQTFFGDPLNYTKLLVLKQQKALSVSWQDKIEQRLVSNQVENWNVRLLDTSS